MITSSSGRRWVFPKGIVEAEMTPQESAAAEALEEAGVEGEVFPSALGSYRREKWGGTVSVALFLMRVSRVLEHWPEKYFRRREWLSLEEAVDRTDDQNLKEILERMKSIPLSP
jgi:8-oxo-dGTP pyrophosphatase MutT (NUDIX family)